MSTPKLNYINNQWVDSGNYKNSVNPSTGEVLGTWADATPQNVNDAIAVALKTFRETDWKDNRHLRANWWKCCRWRTAKCWLKQGLRWI
jgi:betaine-aldehyde dehydrogenase